MIFQQRDGLNRPSCASSRLIWRRCSERMRARQRLIIVAAKDSYLRDATVDTSYAPAVLHMCREVNSK